jgi:hypothetical protein
MKKINILIVFLVSIVIISGLLVYLRKDKLVNKEVPAPTKQEITLTGEFTCLPHKDTSGPQTMECAYGLKTADGKYYAIDTHKNFPSGKIITVTGTLVPVEALNTDTFNKYDIVGIVNVTSSSL